MANEKIEKRYFVYALIDPRNDSIFYIGMGDNNRLSGGFRPDDHLKDATMYNNGKEKNVNVDKCNHILEIIEDTGEKYITDILYESDNFDDVNNKEQYYIKTIGRKDQNSGSLTNKNDGNPGIPFIKGHNPWNKGLCYTYSDIHTEEEALDIKNRISNTLKSIGHKPPDVTGIKRTDEHKKSVSEFWKNKPKPEEQKTKISNTLKGNIPWNKGKTDLPKQTDESNKKRSIALKQYWKNKKEILNGNK